MVVFETILEEAGGMLCGLPPGTVTAVGAIAKASSSSSNTQEHTQVEKKTSGLSKKEKAIVKTAVHNVAVTAQKDNPFWSRQKCEKFAMAVILLADQIYSGSSFKEAILDAVSTNPRRHRRLIRNVGHSL